AAGVGLGGGEPGGGDLGVGEHDPGDPVVGGGARAAQDVAGDDAALVVGDVGEQGDAGDIAQRPQPRPGLAALIDRDGAARAGLEVGGFQAEAAGLGPTAGAQDDHVGLHLGAVVEGDDRAAAGGGLGAGDGAAGAGGDRVGG